MSFPELQQIIYQITITGSLLAVTSPIQHDSMVQHHSDFIDLVKLEAIQYIFKTGIRKEKQLVNHRIKKLRTLNRCYLFNVGNAGFLPISCKSEQNFEMTHIRSHF